MPHLTPPEAGATAELHGDDFRQLVRTMVDGYEAMSDELNRLHRVSSSLERRLRRAHREYESLAARYAFSKDSPIYSERERFGLDDESGSGETHEELVVDASSLFLAQQKLRETGAVTSPKIRDGLEARARVMQELGWRAEEKSEGMHRAQKGRSARSSPSPTTGDPASPEPSAANTSTGPGRAVGPDEQAQCPFAGGGGARPDDHPLASAPEPRQTLQDPEPDARETRGDPVKGGPPSLAGSASKCPIRLLDQRSPEEVARYVEQHKHEIPRSHEICVKRHQSNTESIRQLDEKYGSLVTMIQGLGATHQPLLPAKGDEVAGDGAAGDEAAGDEAAGDEAAGDEAAGDEAAGDEVVSDRVGRWVERVSGGGEAGEAALGGDGASGGEGASVAAEERAGHFDRVLDEVRVGESPQRPWGIHVPEVVPRPPTASHGGHSNLAGAGKGAVPGITFERDSAFVYPPKDAAQRGQRMVFTGPVFIGYPLEQALALAGRAGPGTETT